MKKSEKIKSVIAVLEKREKVCQTARAVLFNQEYSAATELDIAYYDGKLDGYRQAVELLCSSLESINVELEEDESGR